MEHEHILEIDSVRFSVLAGGDYRQILQDIYMRVRTGEIVALLGLNGSGKTSLLKLIYGTLKGDSKNVRFDGTWVKGALFRYPEKVQYAPQFNFIPKHLTVKRIFEDYDISLDMFLSDFPNFNSYVYSKLGALSSGEAQLVETYLIIRSRTAFCLLDEPFSQLMPLHISSLKAIILDEVRCNEKGFVITDHLYRDVLQISDRIYFLKDGLISEINNLEKLADVGYTL